MRLIRIDLLSKIACGIESVAKLDGLVVWSAGVSGGAWDSSDFGTFRLHGWNLVGQYGGEGAHSYAFGYILGHELLFSLCSSIDFCH